MAVEQKRLTINAIPETVMPLAAKLSSEKDKWLPLWVHSLDTCFVAERLFTKWLPTNAQKAMADAMTHEEVLQIVRIAAMLHDLGKATAAFQTRITAESPPLRQKLMSAGLPLLVENSISNQLHSDFSHAAAGEALLMIAGSPLSFAEVIGAHHGRPWVEGRDLRRELQREKKQWSDPRSLALWGNSAQRTIWQDMQADCLRWMELVGRFSTSALPMISQPAAVLMTGLIIMADWIASNEAYFPLIPLDSSAPDNIEERIEKGWRELHLPSSWTPCAMDDWKDMAESQFGFAPNTIQCAVMQAAQESERPGLIILEAPMGLGKTEAALLAANITAKKGAGGIFFGLPTQATANAIFDRIAAWGEKQPETNRISIRLAHGMAELNETYRALMSGSGTSRVEEDGGQDRLIVHEWFRGQKQALLADFVVGTVDQVLMAALRQKHIMLRHLGLCGKTVIIDECHAYDTYMNQYLEMALRWLGAYHTPVILLSATLPAKKRAAFVAAYLNKPQRERTQIQLMREPWYGSSAYPVLTWTNSGKVLQQALIYDGQERSVALTPLSHDDTVESQADAVVQVMTESLEKGGCAAVILNTVRRAQQFAEILKSKLPDTKVLLLHSRFVMPDRLQHEAELLKRMGKKSGKEERDRFIVVGTQVIEQSLDFDADVMVSDLCPIDLLLQRIGRLHRHREHDGMRPARLRESRCFILCSGANLDRGAAMVYGEHLLMRTRALLPGIIQLPSDISRLVNEVYDEAYPLPQMPKGYEQALEEEMRKEDKLKRDADSFRIHDPDDDYSSLLEYVISPDDEHARAQVRAGDMSLDVLLLMRLQSGELSLLPRQRKGETWQTDRSLSAEDARKVLTQRIGLSAGLLRALLYDMSWDELMAATALPEAWKESIWLKQAHLLIMDNQMRAHLGNLILKYNEDTGLTWEKEGDIE